MKEIEKGGKKEKRLSRWEIGRVNFMKERGVKQSEIGEGDEGGEEIWERREREEQEREMTQKIEKAKYNRCK